MLSRTKCWKYRIGLIKGILKKPKRSNLNFSASVLAGFLWTDPLLFRDSNGGSSTKGVYASSQQHLDLAFHTNRQRVSKNCLGSLAGLQKNKAILI